MMMTIKAMIDEDRRDISIKLDCWQLGSKPTCKKTQSQARRKKNENLPRKSATSDRTQTSMVIRQDGGFLPGGPAVERGRLALRYLVDMDDFFLGGLAGA